MVGAGAKMRAREGGVRDKLYNISHPPAGVCGGRQESLLS